MPPKVRQPVTDDSIKVRQLTHYQFSWVAQDPGAPGVFTLQLVLDLDGTGRRALDRFPRRSRQDSTTKPSIQPCPAAVATRCVAGSPLWSCPTTPYPGTWYGVTTAGCSAVGG